MKSTKWAMLNLHLWCMILDLVVTVLIVPILIFPVLGGYPLGILTNWFGIPSIFQIYSFITIMTAVFVAILLIFENRYYQLYAKETIWKRIRVIFVLINYILVIGFFMPVSINYPDQKIALQFAYNVI
uniref:Serpentine receptor class gamma n=1 Tax=Caenorhabditis tropicalis TaxID=1561998 RepID=A0A1I7TVZ8_9PELO